MYVRWYTWASERQTDLSGLSSSLNWNSSHFEPISTHTSGPGHFINPFVIPTLHNYGVSTGSHNSLKTIHTRLNSSSHHLFRFHFHIFPTKPNPAHRKHHLFTLLSSSSQPPPVIPPLQPGIYFQEDPRPRCWACTVHVPLLRLEAEEGTRLPEVAEIAVKRWMNVERDRGRVRRGVACMCGVGAMRKRRGRKNMFGISMIVALGRSRLPVSLNQAKNDGDALGSQLLCRLVERPVVPPDQRPNPRPFVLYTHSNFLCSFCASSKDSRNSLRNHDQN